MRTRHRRLFCLTTLALIALGIGLAGCAWGTVTDSRTGEPIVGAEVTFQDSKGGTGTTTAGTGGLYAFDAAKGQTIPAAGSTTYTISAPGYDTVTVQRNVAYDDNQSVIWEIQGFALTRTGEEPPPPQAGQLAIDVDPLAPGIQTSRAVPASAPFPVDLVLVDPPAPLTAYSITLLYDDTILYAPEVAAQPGPNLDSNPDANQAALGPNWDCSGFGFTYPRGDTNPATGLDQGAAQIDCLTMTGPYPFTGTGVVASVIFIPIRQGTSSLSLLNVVLGGPEGEMGSCNPVIGVATTCGTASISVQ